MAVEIERSIKDIKTEISKGLGPRCKTFDIECYVCRTWMGYDIVESYIHFLKYNDKKMFKSTETGQ